MPWCPKCKNEYKAGILRCADCDVELVEDLGALKKALIFGEQEELFKIKDYLEFSGISDTEIVEDEAESVFELLVAEKDFDKANSLLHFYQKQHAQEELLSQMQEMEDDEAEEGENVRRSGTVYEDSASKAENNKSSAYTLLIVGVIGLAVIVLGALDIIHLPFSGISKYMIYGIMSVLFLLFIVMGVISMKTYKVFAKKAESESNLRDTVTRWCLENLTKDSVDEEFDGESLSEEEKYFKRCVVMKKKICDKFVNLEESFLDDLIDELYSDIFEEDADED